MATADRFVLLRHACAGAKLPDRARDFNRALDREGEEVALRLPAVVTRFLRPGVVISSPLRRCVETVQPLAGVLGVDVEEDERLSPDRPGDVVRETFRDAPANSVVCTHGEVIERLFDGAIKCDKGAFWIVERHGDVLLAAEYVAAPTTGSGGHKE